MSSDDPLRRHAYRCCTALQTLLRTNVFDLGSQLHFGLVIIVWMDSDCVIFLGGMDETDGSLMRPMTHQLTGSETTLTMSSSFFRHGNNSFLTNKRQHMWTLRYWRRLPVIL